MKPHIQALLAVGIAILAGNHLAAVQDASQYLAKKPLAAFDVATIKRSDEKPNAQGLLDSYIRAQPGGQTFFGKNVPVRLLITYSYRIIDAQLAGGPDWIDRVLLLHGIYDVRDSKAEPC